MVVLVERGLGGKVFGLADLHVFQPTVGLRVHVDMQLVASATLGAEVEPSALGPAQASEDALCAVEGKVVESGDLISIDERDVQVVAQIARRGRLRGEDTLRREGEKAVGIKVRVGHAVEVEAPAVVDGPQHVHPQHARRLETPDEAAQSLALQPGILVAPGT